METSLMLHLRPDLVLPREDWGDGDSKSFKIQALSENWAWAERQWSKVTKDTGIGNPHKSTPKKGERFFKDTTRKVGDFMFELCRAELDDLYE